MHTNGNELICPYYPLFAPIQWENWAKSSKIKETSREGERETVHCTAERKRLESESTSKYLHTRLMHEYSVHKQAQVKGKMGTRQLDGEVGKKSRKKSNLLKTFQVFLILNMSHCAGICSATRVKLRVEKGADVNVCWLNGYSEHSTIAVVPEMRLRAR